MSPGGLLFVWGRQSRKRRLEAERSTDELGRQGLTSGATLWAERADRCWPYPVASDRRWHVSFKDTSVYFSPSASNTLMAQVSCFRRQR